MIKLRPYQLSAADEIIRNLISLGCIGVIVEMATGVGKSEIYINVIKRWIGVKSGVVLVLVHKEELLFDALRRLRNTLGSGVVGCEYRNFHPIKVNRVVVTTVQTMYKRRNNFSRNAFNLIIIDEVHHAAAMSWSTVLGYFIEAKRIGLTATLNRLDKKGVGDWFERIAYRYPLAQAIRDGWLVPVHYFPINVKTTLDLRGIPIIAGDFQIRELTKRIRRDEFLSTASIEIARILSRGYKALIFCPDVSAARDVNNIVRNLGYKSRLVIGTTKGRNNIRLLVAAGKVDCVCSVNVYCEAVDLPAVNCIIMMRPTRSSGLYQQMIGRGTRLLGLDITESRIAGKSHCLVVDFVGNTSLHDGGPIDLSDILLPDLPRSVRKRTIERLARDARSDSIETLSIEELLNEINKDKANRIKTNIQRLDPILHIDSVGWSVNDEPMTNEQRDTLISFGVDKDEELTRNHAANAIAILTKRRSLGLATYRQVTVLRRYFISPNLTREDAEMIIINLKKMSWPRPGKATLLQLRSAGCLLDYGNNVIKNRRKQ